MKRRYQPCQYAAVTAQLPALLQAVQWTHQHVDSDDAYRAETLAADAYQVAGSVLLKMGEVPMAVLAADRSMAAAVRSDDRMTRAASARVVTHSLMSSGHLRQATRMAKAEATRLDHAVDYARQVDLDQVTVPERRACLFVDVARAFTQWGKTDRAFRALLAAEHAAPEELRTRPAVRQLVADVARTAPPSLRADVHLLADRVGVNQ